MKKFLIFLCLICLSGCVGGISDSDKQKIQETYKEITTKEKTLKNAFGAWEFYTTFVKHYPFHVGHTNFEYNDYYYRFCNNEKSFKSGDITFEKDISYSIYVAQLFDQGVFTDKEKYCMEDECEFYSWGSQRGSGAKTGSYLHNEDECILIRRQLLSDQNIRVQSTFNYKNYIPENLKINSLEEFEELYKAYNNSIETCEDKKENHVFTTEEHENCLASVEQRLEELAQTGILKEMSIYDDSLDGLGKNRLARAEREQIEEEKKKAEEQRQKQKTADIADCEQAVRKVRAKEKELNGATHIFDKGVYVLYKGERFAETTSAYRVSGFDSKGVFVDNQKKFIYTNDKNYAVGDVFRGNGVLYKQDGNFKYVTTSGYTNSVPAYRATTHKVSEISLSTYLKNKKAACCAVEGEVGVDTTQSLLPHTCSTKKFEWDAFIGILEK